MAKLRDRPITATDLQKYLRGHDSFDLELYVYNKAKKLGLEVTHGGSYEDPVTRKVRQYDVRVAAERDRLRIDLAIECKALRLSFPLLVSRVPRAGAESFHHLIRAHEPEASPDPWTVAPLATNTDVLSRSGKDSIYPPGEMVGESTAQVGRTPNNEVRAGAKPK